MKSSSQAAMWAVMTTSNFFGNHTLQPHQFVTPEPMILLVRYYHHNLQVQEHERQSDVEVL